MTVHVAQTVVEIDGFVGLNTGKSSLHSVNAGHTRCCGQGNFLGFDFHSELHQRL
jgi:hypothetical protein